MSFSLIPRGVYSAVTHISPKALAEKGVRLVLADLDNTLVPYRVIEPSRAVRQWRDALAAEGIALFLLSNSRKPGRPHSFAQKLDIPCIGHAGKPKREGFFRAMERMGVTPDQTVMVGDQIFTDVLGANRSGVTPLLVETLCMSGDGYMEARFGPAGNAVAFSEQYQSSLDAPAWIAGLGLDCYEYQCGKGVRIGQDTAEKLGERARQAGISLSLHAPYFISLSNPDPEMRRKTVGYITTSCLAARWMGATRVVIHTGALLKRTRRQALDIAKETLRQSIAACDDQGFGDVTLCPETMGKINQLGDLDEVLELCQIDGRLLPCIDFGHLYARSLGADDGAEVFARMLDKVASALGEERASRFHSHFSRIEFTPRGGEKCHRTFADHGGFGPDWQPLAAEIARRGWTPTFICESAGTQAEDARTMKDIYRAQRALYTGQGEEETT